MPRFPSRDDCDLTESSTFSPPAPPSCSPPHPTTQLSFFSLCFPFCMFFLPPIYRRLIAEGRFWVLPRRKITSIQLQKNIFPPSRVNRPVRVDLAFAKQGNADGCRYCTCLISFFPSPILSGRYSPVHELPSVRRTHNPFSPSCRFLFDGFSLRDPLIPTSYVSPFTGTLFSRGLFSQMDPVVFSSSPHIEQETAALRTVLLLSLPSSSNHA